MFSLNDSLLKIIMINVSYAAVSAIMLRRFDATFFYDIWNCETFKTLLQDFKSMIFLSEFY